MVVLAMSQTERAVVKLPAETHRQAKGALAQVARYGWADFGIDRDDPPTLGSVIEEAIKLLMARSARRKERR
jgi:hypothetical protein